MTLWQRCIDANLHVDIKSGNATINLQVGLGKAPPLFHYRRQLKPSQERRHQRRAEARQKAAAAKASGENLNDSAKDQVDKAVEASAENGNDSAKDQVDKAVEVVSIEKEIESVEAEVAVASMNNADKVTEDTTEEASENIPPVVQIHATAVFDDSPDGALESDAIGSLFKLVKHKEHLEKNIENIEWKHLSTREFRATRFKHTADVILYVKTANLWEGARSYVWKHLGQETWTRGNGTVISLSRIHQR